MVKTERDIQGIAASALRYFEECKQLKHLREEPNNRVSSHWHKPPPGIVKLNFDGGLGAVLGAAQQVVSRAVKQADGSRADPFNRKKFRVRALIFSARLNQVFF